MSGGYYTAKQINDRTTIAVSTLSNWAREGKGPPSTKLGRRRVWPKDEFDAWLAANTTDPVPHLNTQLGGAQVRDRPST